ncbi:MAG: hypothetical protein U0354_05675 [Candidatus Sericytochromatia bacterium]
MRFGIISEGKSDQAVLTNILKGLLDIDKSNILYIQPENYLDETDLNSPKYLKNIKSFSNWELVKYECQSKLKIFDFLNNSIDDKKIIIIQIDSAECDLKNYDVERPTKEQKENYVFELRDRISKKIDEWISEDINNLIYAICVEETDAWILSIYTNDNKDTGLIIDPKKNLDEILKVKLSKSKLNIINNLNSFESYFEKSKEFRKYKNLKKFSLKNKSLDVFCNILESKVKTNE